MAKRLLQRFFIPVVLLVGAALVWALWPNEVRQAETPIVVPTGLVVVALIFAFQSFLEEMFDIPIALWVIAVIIVVVGMVLFFSSTVGILGITALIVFAIVFFFS